MSGLHHILFYILYKMETFIEDIQNQYLSMISPPRKRQRKAKVCNRHRNRGYALREIDEMSDNDFKLSYRITGKNIVSHSNI